MSGHSRPQNFRTISATANPACPECAGAGARDSGGSQPWGEPILLPCDCSLATESAPADHPSEFAEGQWWLAELDAMVANGTPDQQRAMAVVRHLMRSAHQHAAPAAPCRADGRCQYAIDHGAEGLGHCPAGRCAMPGDHAATIRWLQDSLRDAGKCIDGGHCHHGCGRDSKSSCFRQQCCVPLSGSGLRDDWSLPPHGAGKP